MNHPIYHPINHPIFCAYCHQSLCHHPDAVFQGVVVMGHPHEAAFQAEAAIGHTLEAVAHEAVPHKMVIDQQSDAGAWADALRFPPYDDAPGEGADKGSQDEQRAYVSGPITDPASGLPLAKTSPAARLATYCRANIRAMMKRRSQAARKGWVTRKRDKKGPYKKEGAR